MLLLLLLLLLLPLPLLPLLLLLLPLLLLLLLPLLLLREERMPRSLQRLLSALPPPDLNASLRPRPWHPCRQQLPRQPRPLHPPHMPEQQNMAPVSSA